MRQSGLSFCVKITRGHERSDGFVFWAYTSWGGEWWIEKEKFKLKIETAKISSREIYKKKISAIPKDSKIKRGTENENGLLFWGYHPSYLNCELWLSIDQFKEKKEWKSNHNKKWAVENKARSNFLKRRWEENNPQKHQNSQLAIRLNRRARKKENGGTVTSLEIKELKVKSKNTCFYCKRTGKLSIDHGVPLKLGGRNEISNMVIACINCNSQKQAKDPLVYAKEIGRLLI